jgi:hypothetical protein
LLFSFDLTFAVLKLQKTPRGNRVSTDPGGTTYTQYLEGFCNNCILLSADPSLTFENKSKIALTDGIYNHHIAVAGIGKKSTVPFQCSRAGFSFGSASASSSQLLGFPFSLIFGAGHDDIGVEWAVKNSSLKTGRRIAKGESMIHSSQFVTYQQNDQQVFLTFEIEYVPDSPEWLDASLQSMSATGCDTVAMSEPPSLTFNMQFFGNCTKYRILLTVIRSGRR